MKSEDKLKQFKEEKSNARLSKEDIKKQHDKGKLTVWERIDTLLDKGSFIEFDEFAESQSHDYDIQKKKKPRDGVVTGVGRIDGRKVCIYAQDFTFMGGSMGETHTRKIAKIMKSALKLGCPIIGLLDSGGARIQEGVSGLDGGGEIFYNNTLCSGVVPQISAIMGPCAGIAVYSPALTDFVFMVNKTSNMFITGPKVIKSVTGQEIGFEELGGAKVHNEKSGVAHFHCEDEKECLLKIKKLLSYLPQNNVDSPPVLDTKDMPDRKSTAIKDMIPEDTKKVYDAAGVIEEVLDKKSFFQTMENYAQNAITGLGRLNNNVVGIVANQPQVLAGCLDINSSDKISRFVRFCDSFNIPIINFVDVTGYLPGTEQEHNGIIRHGAKILYAYSEATVPKISLVMRKAYGGAYIALVSKDMGYDRVIAWPTAEIAVMGAEGAVNILERKEIKKSKNPDKLKSKKIKEFEENFLNPYVAAKKGKVDMIIDFADTRNALINVLEVILTKREKMPPKKHGNLPL
ncbi:methylmalonyl-CoA carboxyltransferase [Candidatus Woesearchaeota archaeon]|nr:methylmalonyl-CoA carboxyltransferase [Candidatus Woesearchaeota archaeon]